MAFVLLAGPCQDCFLPSLSAVAIFPSHLRALSLDYISTCEGRYRQLPNIRFKWCASCQPTGAGAGTAGSGWRAKHPQEPMPGHTQTAAPQGLCSPHVAWSVTKRAETRGEQSAVQTAILEMSMDVDTAITIVQAGKRIPHLPGLWAPASVGFIAQMAMTFTFVFSGDRSKLVCVLC